VRIPALEPSCIRVGGAAQEWRERGCSGRRRMILELYITLDYVEHAWCDAFVSLCVLWTAGAHVAHRGGGCVRVCEKSGADMVVRVEALQA
jgi:hypothetical protein